MNKKVIASIIAAILIVCIVIVAYISSLSPNSIIQSVGGIQALSQDLYTQDQSFQQQLQSYDQSNNSFPYEITTSTKGDLIFISHTGQKDITKINICNKIEEPYGSSDGQCPVYQFTSSGTVHSVGGGIGYFYIPYYGTMPLLKMDKNLIVSDYIIGECIPNSENVENEIAAIGPVTTNVGLYETKTTWEATGGARIMCN